jgi:hypothetical protein
VKKKEKKAKPKVSYITQTKVLDLTLMSYHNLRRKIRAGTFPAPVTKNKYGKHLYEEEAVKNWVKENCHWARRLRETNASIDLMNAELKTVFRAAKILECDVEPFIIDAALWKANKILEAMGEE